MQLILFIFRYFILIVELSDFSFFILMFTQYYTFSNRMLLLTSYACACPIVNQLSFTVDILSCLFYTSVIFWDKTKGKEFCHVIRQTITTMNNTVNSTTTKKLSTRKLVLIALMTAITCIFAPMAIPIPVSPVPISLTNLVIMISIYVLGFRDATISYIVYLLLGLVGLPVFSGFPAVSASFSDRPADISLVSSSLHWFPDCSLINFQRTESWQLSVWSSVWQSLISSVQSGLRSSWKCHSLQHFLSE